MFEHDAKIVKAMIHNSYAPLINEPDFGDYSSMQSSQWYVRASKNGREFIIKGTDLYSLHLIEVGLGASGISTKEHYIGSEIRHVQEFLKECK